MHYATKHRKRQILVWLVWLIACLVFLVWPEQAIVTDWPVFELPALPGVVTYESRDGFLFPWQSRQRWRKWAWRRYCAWRHAHRRAIWVARLARLAFTGALSLAQVVDLLTQVQFRRLWALCRCCMPCWKSCKCGPSSIVTQSPLDAPQQAGGRKADSPAGEFPVAKGKKQWYS